MRIKLTKTPIFPHPHHVTLMRTMCLHSVDDDEDSDAKTTKRPNERPKRNTRKKAKWVCLVHSFYVLPYLACDKRGVVVYHDVMLNVTRTGISTEEPFADINVSSHYVTHCQARRIRRRTFCSHYCYVTRYQARCVWHWCYWRGGRAKPNPYMSKILSNQLCSLRVLWFSWPHDPQQSDTTVNVMPTPSGLTIVRQSINQLIACCFQRQLSLGKIFGRAFKKEKIWNTDESSGECNTAPDDIVSRFSHFAWRRWGVSSRLGNTAPTVQGLERRDHYAHRRTLHIPLWGEVYPWINLCEGRGGVAGLNLDGNGGECRILFV